MRRRLELRAASARGNLAAVRARIRDLLDIGPFAQYGYVEYADACAYADQAGQAVSAIRAVAGSGRAAGAVALARGAMCLLTRAAESVDDPVVLNDTLVAESRRNDSLDYVRSTALDRVRRPSTFSSRLSSPGTDLRSSMRTSQPRRKQDSSAAARVVEKTTVRPRRVQESHPTR